MKKEPASDLLAPSRWLYVALICGIILSVVMMLAVLSVTFTEPERESTPEGGNAETVMAPPLFYAAPYFLLLANDQAG